MKKRLTILLFALGTLSLNAQNLTSKKGEPILPQAGDWAISLDASPFLNYAGQLLSNAGGIAPTWNFLNANNTIIGKYFKDEKTAYRGILRIGLNSTTTNAQVADASVTTAPVYPAVPAMKTDKWRASNTFIGLGAGMEHRRGKTRLQGYYGADAMLWYMSNANNYTYGNALSTSNTNPVGVNAGTTHNFGANLVNDAYGNNARVTQMKGGATFGIGVRGFIGAEYFIIPKISIGGEFGWGIGYTMTGKGSTTTESIGGATPSVGSIKTETAGNSAIMLDTDRNAFQSATGTMHITLHF